MPRTEFELACGDLETLTNSIPDGGGCCTALGSGVDGRHRTVAQADCTGG